MNIGRMLARAPGLLAIDLEIARQHGDALVSFGKSGAIAAEAAAALKKAGKLLLLGIGGSYAVNRTVEPLFCSLALDAVALPISEQLGQTALQANRGHLCSGRPHHSFQNLRHQ